MRSVRAYLCTHISNVAGTTLCRNDGFEDSPPVLHGAKKFRNSLKSHRELCSQYSRKTSVCCRILLAKSLFESLRNFGRLKTQSILFSLQVSVHLCVDSPWGRRSRKEKTALADSKWKRLGILSLLLHFSKQNFIEFSYSFKVLLPSEACLSRLHDSHKNDMVPTYYI